jgi:hypothetical protein
MVLPCLDFSYPRRVPLKRTISLQTNLDILFYVRSVEHIKLFQYTFAELIADKRTPLFNIGPASVQPHFTLSDVKFILQHQRP